MSVPVGEELATDQPRKMVKYQRVDFPFFSS